MAVYVLLGFDDEESAKELVIDTRYDGTFITHTGFVTKPCKVFGIWKRPTQFCDPTDGHRGKKTEAGWTRGKRFGWWVCGKCGKPSNKMIKMGSWFLALGNNLLPPELRPIKDYMEPGWQESPDMWNFLLPESTLENQE